MCLEMLLAICSETSQTMIDNLISLSNQYLQPDGDCFFNQVIDTLKEQNGIQDDENGEDSSIQPALNSVMTMNPDPDMTIIDGSHQLENDLFPRKFSGNLKKHAGAFATLLHGRKRSKNKNRNFKSTFMGLRNDTEYVIKISFVLSGRKLGSESYRILQSDESLSRKSSVESTSSGIIY